ncbi:HAMP domain-containing sensor histidine kinase [Pseudonocardia sp. GCM10023141]|uniref:HAMP domain-containing sensor histidine kinase n=1 Tax=Pseudonocardia sp. GCM10023141 TaxID=3252653 RepID=UPI0036230C51
MTAARGSLAWRITASCLLVAIVAVGVAALVSLRLVATTARDVTADALAQQADVVAAQLDDAARPVQGALGLRRVVQVLQGQGITVVVLPDRRDTATGPVAVAVQKSGAARAVQGTPVSAVVDVAGTAYLVEARQAPSGAFALVRTTDVGPLGAGVLRRNIGVALLAGGVAALVVGGVVGTLLARPLRRTAAAAHLLRGGRRDVRVPVQGPSEVAEVAGAVNELADALARSEHRQREFLLSVSHELRTPLTAVRGFAESIADGVVEGPDAAAAGRVVVDEARRLDRLVTDLMELARLEADDFSIDLATVDLVALVGDAATVWRARAAAGAVVLRLVVPAEPVPVMADPRRLRQVLDGLAENALRVLPAGAPLVFEVRAGGELQVRDGGPGLAPEDYAVVFDRGALHARYERRRPVGVGGIGLALVHGLVTRMGGTIAAEQAVEGGACFTVRLPAP